MGIVAGKFITGSQLVYEKPTVEVPVVPTHNVIAIKSLSELRTSDNFEVKENTDGSKEIVAIDKRLSSYFVINKESDYLDHNTKLNRR